MRQKKPASERYHHPISSNRVLQVQNVVISGPPRSRLSASPTQLCFCAHKLCNSEWSSDQLLKPTTPQSWPSTAGHVLMRLFPLSDWGCRLFQYPVFRSRCLGKCPQSQSWVCRSFSINLPSNTPVESTHLHDLWPTSSVRWLYLYADSH